MASATRLLATQTATDSVNVKCKPGSQEQCAHEGLPDWILHLAEKNWADIDDFATAFIVGSAIHGPTDLFSGKQIMEVVAIAKAERARAQSFAKYCKKHHEGRVMSVQRLGELHDAWVGDIGC